MGRILACSQKKGTATDLRGVVARLSWNRHGRARGKDQEAGAPEGARCRAPTRARCRANTGTRARPETLPLAVPRACKRDPGETAVAALNRATAPRGLAL